MVSYCYIIAVSVVALGLCVPIPAHSESKEKTISEKFIKGQVSRQMATSKTFATPVVEYLQRPLASQLTTINLKGSPQVTVMWFKEENGALLFTTTTDRIKFRNMQKDTRAVFSVVDPANMYKWVVVHGKLSVDNRDPAAFYRGLADHYLDGDALADWKKMAMMDKRTVLKLTPTQVRTMGFPQQ